MLPSVESVFIQDARVTVTSARVATPAASFGLGELARVWVTKGGGRGSLAGVGALGLLGTIGLQMLLFLRGGAPSSVYLVIPLGLAISVVFIVLGVVFRKHSCTIMLQTTRGEVALLKTQDEPFAMHVAQAIHHSLGNRAR